MNKKLVITGEGEESVWVPPYPLDSILRDVELLIEVNPVGRLSEKEKKELSREIMYTLPYFQQYLFLERYIREVYTGLKTRYKFKDREMKALMNAILYCVSSDNEQVLRVEGMIEQEYRFSPSISIVVKDSMTEGIHGE